MENVGRIDLREQNKGIETPFFSFVRNIKPISIFSVKNHDEVREKSERIADSRLEALARKAIEINNEHSDNYWSLWTLYYKSMKLNYQWDCELVGGRLKQKAANTLFQLKTNTPVDPTNLPPIQKDLNQKMDGWFGSDPICGLTEKETTKLAKEVFGSTDSKKQLIFTSIPEDIGANILIYETKINSEEYDSLPDEKGNFKGLEINGYEIPKAYNNFVKMLIGDKENLSKQEAQKLLDTIKALETINAFNKPQQKGSANAQKEDVDIFDISGDGLLNRGDITAMELFIKLGTDKDFARKLEDLNAENWNSLKSLRTVSGLTDKKTRELFDLDGNGNVDTKDYELYKQMLNNPNKFDIDGDNFVDGKDIALTKEYFKALLLRAQEDKTFRKNTEEIVGSPEQMENLQKKIYKK